MKYIDNTYAGLMAPLLKTEELESRLSELAMTRVRPSRRIEAKMFAQLSAEKRALYSAYKRIRESRADIPAASLFRDEFYVIEKALIAAENAAESYRRLPVEAEGDGLGLPRAYHIAVSIVGHSEASLDMERVKRALEAYQAVEPLNMRELWAFADLLRFSLIKLVRMLAFGCEITVKASEKAQTAAKTLSGLSSARARSEYIEKLDPEHNHELAARLFELLFEMDDYADIERLDACMKRADIHIDEVCIRNRQAQQTQMRLMRNAINSLRFVDAIDRPAFFEQYSRVEHILREDGVYGAMDAASREYYRSGVERAARDLSVHEAVVAREAVRLCANKTGKQAHAGYYLVSDGVCELHQRIRPDRNLASANEHEKLRAYLAVRAVLTLAFAALASDLGLAGVLLALLPGWSLAGFITTKVILACGVNRHIPRLDEEEVLERRTLVVLPVLITGERDLRQSIRQLETHYLANPLPGSRFAVLGDFKDSAKLVEQGENALLELAKQETEKLNAKYGFESTEPAKFFFLHRKREYASADSLYMGYERKRGALKTLVKLLTGDEHSRRSFLLISSPLPKDIEYCVTLDADTVLPHGALAELIGAAAHPLNRAEIGEDGAVKSGYGVIFPRMQAHASGASRSPFTKIFSGDAGMDSYSVCVAELNQNVFGSSIFSGKGIFDVQAFLAAQRHIPDNTVLSHDLLEGSYMRAGFMGDTVLYDAEPGDFIRWWKRAHRWIRGDWQLIPFLAGSVQNENGALARNVLSPLSKYHILDNLVRSVTPLAHIAAVLAAPVLGYGWYLALFAADIFKAVALDIIATAVRSFSESDFKEAISDQYANFLRVLYDLAALPYACLKSADAIIRTLRRVLFSHKHMLEWQTAAQASGGTDSPAGYYRQLWVCPLLGVVLAIGGALGKAPVFCALFSLLWLGFPLLAWRLDQTFKPQALQESERNMLLEIALSTWKYFETFATEKNNYLPPDNFQQHPEKSVVANTSPTNIGMGLISCAAAYELGFIQPSTLLERVEHTLSTLEHMSKWHGHLYNWYNIQTLEVLSPKYVSTVDSGNLAACLLTMEEFLHELSGGKPLAERCRKLAMAMDFAVLYDKSKHLFRIGYNGDLGEYSESWYDLLASEARLTSFVAVALGQVEKKHWFKLSRLLVKSGRGRALISWSGTMFEYLMPLIFTGMVEGTLLHESCENAVAEQRAYCPKTPWGISESGYYAFDRFMYYQYRAFGVPRLGLQPVSVNEQVVAPYASALALMVSPAPAAQNLERFTDMGMLDEYGLYEAVDYTKGRAGLEGMQIVRSFMAHHQGMTLCAIANLLKDNAISRRFMAVPEMHAARMLLEEKKPPHSLTIRAFRRGPADSEAKSVVYTPRRSVASGVLPETQLLTNGRYAVFASDEGLGFSRCEEVMLTRWRPDTLRSDSGVRIFVKDQDVVWEMANCETEFEPHVVKYRRRDGDIRSAMSVCVSTRCDGEMRTLTLSNTGTQRKSLTVGAFFEVCLTTQRRDEAHPAFNKLRINAELEGDVLLFNRRPAGEEQGAWLFCTLQGGGGVRFSSDRLRIPGRFNSYQDAMRLTLLQEGVEAPIEPCAHARVELEIPAGESAQVQFLLGFATTREAALSAANVMLTQAQETLSLAWAHANSMLYFSGIDRAKADLFERIASRLILREPTKPRLAKDQEEGIRGLWKFGISGDNPIVLARIENASQAPIAKTLLMFGGYMAARGEPCDVVIIGEYKNEYRNELGVRLEEMTNAFSSGNVYLLPAFSLTQEDRNLLESLAMLVIDTRRSLERQFIPRQRHDPEPMEIKPANLGAFASEPEPLKFGGLGGFNEKGEYVIRLGGGEHTPLPWSNVLANPHFGTLVTESGGGHTWRGNSREYKLTPWYNDPVKDPKGEMILILDQEDGTAFEVTPGRLQGDSVCTIRHGFGYSEYVSDTQALHSTLTVFVDREDPVKYSLLTLSNPMMRRRRLKVLYMAEWVLGVQTHPETLNVWHENGVLFARNLRNPSTGEYGYMTLAQQKSEYSADRKTILNGGWDDAQLNGECGLGLGAFGALRTELTLEPGQSRELLLLLGEDTQDKALEKAHMSVEEAKDKLQAVKDYWRDELGLLRVETPDEAANLMLGGWLMYQMKSSRLLGRTGYYQCSGAIGYRDQLQDMLALKLTQPEQLRAHILVCAGRQFEAGDVLHWWHAPYNGVRTRIQDDRLFLPYAVLEYIETTQDWRILREQAFYLEDAPIPEGEKDLYANMRPSAVSEDLFDHCVRAIDSIRFGAHGLPLMDGGDWNDAMDLVGADGGESVWLGWFLLHILERFAPLARKYKHAELAQRYEHRAKALRESLEHSAWDGAWYMRAFFGDGTPLGSSSNSECSIDCISQSWAAICGAEHAQQAMNSLMRMLVDEQNSLVRLLTPPFSEVRPERPAGYISAYLPGVRENGGQYTHGAIWSILGACAIGNKEMATRLFAMLNPITHGANTQGQLRYKGEPYVMAGDVYSVGRNAGRAGWTWYTGGAGWLYTAGIEYLLGIRRSGDTLSISPCTTWDNFRFTYRVGRAEYDVRVRRAEDGCATPYSIHLEDDAKVHSLEVALRW